jgi:hypothetical protein
LVNWIIIEDQPFSTVEKIFFQKMIKRLNSEVNIPSADTIHNDITKFFQSETEYIKKELKVYYKLFLL